MEGIQEDYKRGQFYLSVNFDLGKMGPGGHGGGLKAWDPVKQKEVWFQKNSLPFNGGTMTTASGLVFAGDIQGMFRAFDAKTGKVLWEFQTGSAINAQPITYTLAGRQYVTVLSGLATGTSLRRETAGKVQPGASVWTFAIMKD